MYSRESSFVATKYLACFDQVLRSHKQYRDYQKPKQFTGVNFFIFGKNKLLEIHAEEAAEISARCFRTTRARVVSVR